jgi:hypothetical protein
VVRRRVAGEVIGVEQRLGHETQDVIVLGGVVDPVAVSPGIDEPSEAKFGEVL